MQISFVVLIVLFSEQISGEAKVCEGDVFKGGGLSQGLPPCGRKPADWCLCQKKSAMFISCE